MRSLSKLAVVMSCLLAGLGIGSTTHAATATTDTFANTVVVNFSAIGMCARVTNSATISYNFDAGRPGRVPRTFKDIKVSNPKVYVRMYTLSGSTCTTTAATAHRVSISQRWSGYSCSYNPSISVGIPYSIGVSFWPSCGNRNQAIYSTSYTSGSTYTQSNTGSPIQFGNASYNTVANPCYGAYVSMTVWKNGTTSDSNNSAAFQRCLTP